MSTSLFESLEPRQLFAGVTILATGRLGTLTGWMQTMASAITTRLGGASEVPQYILSITPDDRGQLRAHVSHVNGTATPQNGSSGEIVVTIDYYSVSADINYPLTWISDIEADFILNTPVDGIRLAELPIHEIGLSRGTGLTDELARSLGRAGVWVDQETYCDPQPIAAQNDAPATLYDNVAFVDNYWRTDFDPDNTDKDGYPVDGAYNLNVQWVQDEHNGYQFAHLAPAGYYIGTIDPNATQSGEGPIYKDWYGTTPDKPARDQTGFIYSNVVGAPRPLSGVWSASGGSGARTANTEQVGTQWPNVTDLAVSSQSIEVGQSIQINFLQQDRDDNATVTFYLDGDRNPYNGDFAHTLGSANLSASTSISSGQISGSTVGLPAGNYWLCAKIADQQGQFRYSYGKQITVAAVPPVAAEGNDGTLRIAGTGKNDTIKISKSPSASDRLVVNVNGKSATFSLSTIERIFCDGLAGNDYLGVNEKYGAISIPMRLNGGAGNDTLIGGSGKDTLSGDAGNDRLYGGSGRDYVNGGDGTDRLFGQLGKDFFIKPKAKELLDFGKGDILR